MPSRPATQKIAFTASIVILLLSAVILPFAVPRLPIPLRIVISASDVLGAVIIYVLMRQRFSRPPSP
jgi:hypothetical protein